MNADAVLFDLDGTLADTAPDLGAAVNRLLAERGRPAVALDQLRPHTSSGVRGMLLAAFDIRPGELDYDALSERFLELYEQNLCVDTRLFDDIDDLLSSLERRSIKWGIVTNKRARFTDPLIAALDLHHRACCVISGDSAPRPKPAPDPLLLACEVSGIEPARCIYVGDDLRDIQSGRAAGMLTVAAAYGYLGLDSPVSDWAADHIIDSPADLIRLLGL